MDVAGRANPPTPPQNGPAAQLPPPVLAVAFVLDSSDIVGSEYLRIFQTYLMPWMKRLTEENPGYNVRLGVVIYGPADTYPCPILAKNFFSDTRSVFNNMKNLGIGTSISNPEPGMVALDALVAALEMFESFSSPDVLRHLEKPTIHHLVQIAAAPPDSAVNPSWNDNTLFDNLTWETLPEELKKRKIHFSTIQVQKQIPEFTTFHAACLQGPPVSPWFALQEGDSFLLSGVTCPPAGVQPASTPVKAGSAGIKRQSESTTTDANPPDAKRQKTAAEAPPPLNPPPNPVAVKPEAPKPPAIVPPIPANPPPAPNIPTPAVAAPSNSPIPSIATFNALSPQQKQSVLYQILNRGRACSTRMDQMKALMLQPAVAGNPERTKQVQDEYTKLEKALQAIKQTYTEMVKSIPDAQKPNFGQDLSTPPPASTPLGSLPGTPPSPYGALGHQRTPSQPLSPMTHARGPSNPSNSFPAAGEASSAPTQPTIQSAPQPGMPSDVASQMQKLIEQNRRHSSGQLEPPTFGPKATMQASPPQPNPTPSSFGVPQQPPTSAPLNAIQPVWNGLITMQTTSQTGQPIELMCYAIGMTGNPNHRANLWPQKMVISPSTMPKTPKSDEGVKELFKKPTTVAATLVANPNPPMSIGSRNGGMFMLIQKAMAEKTVFSVFAWANPDGQKMNVIFYPDKTKIYMAATPLVNNPLSSMPPALNGMPMTPEVMMKLQSLPPAEKVKFVNALRLQLLAQRQQAQQGPTPMNFAALGSVGGSNPNNSAGNAALGGLFGAGGGGSMPNNMGVAFPAFNSNSLPGTAGQFGMGMNNNAAAAAAMMNRQNMGFMGFPQQPQSGQNQNQGGGTPGAFPNEAVMQSFLQRSGGT
ncbi:hypothetical protein DL96DRAFT_1583937 [Flagelloscypha sp. PMI_526]|nr:hypothetical protein DL96DRAFT_1583937 [Flagelloscypha sp. PMI_526]